MSRRLPRKPGWPPAFVSSTGDMATLCLPALLLASGIQALRRVSDPWTARHTPSIYLFLVKQKLHQYLMKLISGKRYFPVVLIYVQTFYIASFGKNFHSKKDIL
jgi:hypothetical protein